MAYAIITERRRVMSQVIRMMERTTRLARLVREKQIVLEGYLEGRITREELEFKARCIARRRAEIGR
jgi:hypothetical protein